MYTYYLDHWGHAYPDRAVFRNKLQRLSAHELAQSLCIVILAPVLLHVATAETLKRLIYVYVYVCVCVCVCGCVYVC